MTDKTETPLTDAWIDEESVDIYEGPTDKPVPYLNAERCRQLERTLREREELMNDLLACASRVYAKYGADKDWSEWIDLKDAIDAALPQSEQKP